MTANLENLDYEEQFELKMSIDLPEGTLAVVSDNSIELDEENRRVQVDLISLSTPKAESEDSEAADPSLSPAGPQDVNSGIFVRMEGEKKINISVQKDGNEVASTSVDY